MDINVNEKIKGIENILSYGSEMLLIGMATIFSVLIIILVSIKLLQVFLSGSSNNKETSKVKASVVNDVQPTVPGSLNEEIIAVIAAAIATAESECNGVKFKVVSFRKI